MNEEKNSPQTEASATPLVDGEAASQAEHAAASSEGATQEAGAEIRTESAAAAIGNQEDNPLSNESGQTMTAKEEDSAAKETAAPETANGIWSALFNGFAKGGPIILLAAMACLAWHDLYKPENAVYCPPEFRSITAFLHCIAEGSWLTPIGLDNGAWIAPQWPGFLWFVGLLAWIPELGSSSLLLPVAEFCAAAIAVCAIWWLALTCKFGSRAAFAAGMMALCCPLFAPLPNFMGPGALAAGLMLLALLFFLKGWRKDYSLLSVPLGFILTALAGLTGGLPHFATPLVASCCFLIWTGQFRRAQRMDAIIGFICLLAIIGAWLGIVMVKGENPDYLPGLFGAYAPEWPLARHWWFAIAAGFLGSLPWLLTIFGVSWARVLAKIGQAARDSRHSNGSAMIWTSLLTAAAISIWTPNFHSAAIAICSLLLILLGKAFMRMPAAGNRFFFFLGALITTVVGLGIFAMHFEFSQNWLLETTGLPIPEIAREALRQIPDFMCIAGILTVGGIIGFYFAKRFQHAGGLLYALLIAILLSLPGRLLVVPELAKDPALPVRTFDAIQTEVQSRLASAGQREANSQQPSETRETDNNLAPSAIQPDTTTQIPAMPSEPDAAAIQESSPVMEQSDIRPPSRGRTIPPANSTGASAVNNQENEQVPAPEPLVPSAETREPAAPETQEQPADPTQPPLESAAPETTPPASQEPAQPDISPQPEEAASAPLPATGEPVLDLPEKSEAVEESLPEKKHLAPDMPDHPSTEAPSN